MPYFHCVLLEKQCNFWPITVCCEPLDRTVYFLIFSLQLYRPVFRRHTVDSPGHFNVPYQWETLFFRFVSMSLSLKIELQRKRWEHLIKSYDTAPLFYYMKHILILGSRVIAVIVFCEFFPDMCWKCFIPQAAKFSRVYLIGCELLYIED